MNKMAAICVLLVMLLPGAAFASELCSWMGGVCRDRCGAQEQAETGVFEDCSEHQECCVVVRQRPDALCCISSFDAARSGPANCSRPEQGHCAAGSPSPVPCDRLNLCR